MKLSHPDYLQWMGIDTFQRKRVTESPARDETGLADFDTLQEEVKNCTACPLHCSRTQTVFARGNPHARLMVIGEAPGFHEDREGKPFVGRAGKLLDAMLSAIGIDGNSVYIANILKCRPPGNRDPEASEISQCTPFLDRQIALAKPDLLLAVGRIAAHHLLKTKRPLGQLRQTLHTYGEDQTPLIVTYHPAYLLRNPADKRRAYTDLQFATRTLAGQEGKQDE